MQFFLNAGNGFLSNDARSVVQQPRNHQLPLAPGAEVGSLMHLSNRLVVSAALWWLDLENELVYVGDVGATENKGASRRVGIDFSARLQIVNWLFADGDFNISRNRFTDEIFGTELKENYYIPLAPIISSAGGLTAQCKNGLEIGLRYRYLSSRPANETNTIKARGYTILDFSAHYKLKNFKLGFVIENLANREWNEAQFATETRMFNETTSVDELHFTPGTPISGKFTAGYLF